MLCLNYLVIELSCQVIQNTEINMHDITANIGVEKTGGNDQNLLK